MQNTKAVMQALPLVASILGKKYGVRVEIGGAQAYTDGQTIHLPALPLDVPEEFLTLARGYVDHEAAHIRETDFTLLREVVLSPLEHHVWNIIEDWRVENALVHKFPGCRENFRWLIQHVFSQRVPDCKLPGVTILNWMVLFVRTWDVPSLAEVRDDLAAQMDREIPGLRMRLEKILDEVRISCRSTARAVEYARKIVRELQLTAEGEAQPEASSEDASPSSNQDPVSVSQAPANQKLQSLLSATQDELPPALGEVLAAQLESESQLAGPQRLEVAKVNPRPLLALTAQEIQEALQTSVALRAKLHGLLQATVQVRAVAGRQGRLDTKNLYKLTTAEPRVFCRHAARQGINTAVHILLDCSGSMVRRIKLTAMACYAVAKALSQLRVNVAITAFPGACLPDGSFCSVAPIVRHGQQVHSRLNLDPDGSTPMAEALWWTMQNMLGLRENRKVILILTDGEPDSYDATIHALRTAKDIGFEVHGIGIGSTGMEYLLPEHSRTIHRLTDLPPVVFEILTKTLVRPA